MIDQFVSAIREETGIPVQDGRYLLFGNAFEKYSLMLFEEGARFPSVVAKCPFSDRSVARCQAEYDGLRYFSGLGLENVRVPQPLGKVSGANGRPIFLQGYLPGELLLGGLGLFRRRMDRSHVDFALDALVEIYQKSASEKPDSEPSGTSTHSCAVHGDFWLGNLMALNGDFGLLDLEFFRPDGSVLYDLLHFGLYYQRVLSNIGTYTLLGHKESDSDSQRDLRVLQLKVADVESLLCKDNPTSRNFLAGVRRYVDLCRIDKSEVAGIVRGFVEDDRGVSGLNPVWIEQFEELFFEGRKHDKQGP